VGDGGVGLTIQALRQSEAMHGLDSKHHNAKAATSQGFIE
jgi:hypothetical protein